MRIGHTAINDGAVPPPNGRLTVIKMLSLAGAALAMTASAIVPVSMADAQSRYYGDRYDHAYNRAYRDGYNHGPRYYREDYRSYRGHRCKDGDGGTIIGAIAGGLLGRTVDRHGDRALGTILGAGAGALAGRAIDRADPPRYCR